MPAHLKTLKSVTVGKFELMFTRYRHSLKMGGNFTVTNSLPQCSLSKNSMSEKVTCTLRIDQPRFESVAECSVFIIFECSHDAVFKMYRLDSVFKVYRFQFQNLPAKNVPFQI